MTQNFLSIHAKSFNWAGFFLPKNVYHNCSKLYAFCRVLDDLVDEKTNLELRMERFNEIFLERSPIIEQTPEQKVNEDVKNIKFSGICFNYPNKHIKALEEINLELSAGQTLGVV